VDLIDGNAVGIALRQFGIEVEAWFGGAAEPKCMTLVSTGKRTELLPEGRHVLPHTGRDIEQGQTEHIPGLEVTSYVRNGARHGIDRVH
jgi:hypothetical protein